LNLTWQLPWSTSNEDLVDLFTTIGQVKQAEIQYEGDGRSKGSGIVEFDSPDNAETAICKNHSLFIHLACL
jgi:RNA recognition motif-containing protein